MAHNGNGSTATNGMSAAFINDDALVLLNFRETDPHVVRHVAEVDDTEAAVHHCLQVGARALNAAQTTTDAALVEHAFEGMTSEFTTKVNAAVKEITETAGALLDEEDGELTSTLSAWRKDVDEHLGAYFDPNSKRSIVSKLETMLEQARAAQIEALKRIIDPHDDNSPLGRYRAEIIKAVKEETAEVRKAVAQVSEKIAVRNAEADLLDKTSTKGTSFEDVVHLAVAATASAHGDLAEQTGRTVGIDGNQAGDEVITLNPDDTPGTCGRIVIEVKDRKLGMAGTVDEIDAAKSNRGALAGIAVFSRQAHSPAGAAFVHNGTRAIVTLDKDVLDDGVLRVALLWGRWTVRRQLLDAGDGLSVERIEALLDDACRALEKVATIRRCHSTAKKKIDEAIGHVSELAQEVEAALDALRDEIGR